MFHTAGDTEGNLIYRKTSRNHNPAIATAGKVTPLPGRMARARTLPAAERAPCRAIACKVTIAEVEELVPAGTLDPDQVHARVGILPPPSPTFSHLL